MRKIKQRAKRLLKHQPARKKRRTPAPVRRWRGPMWPTYSNLRFSRFRTKAHRQ